MRITESQLRRIVREERARLQEMGMGHEEMMRLEAQLFEAMESFYASAARVLGHMPALDRIRDLASEFAEDNR